MYVYMNNLSFHLCNSFGDSKPFWFRKKTYTTASSIYYEVLELGVYYYKCNIMIKTIT